MRYIIAYVVVVSLLFWLTVTKYYFKSQDLTIKLREVQSELDELKANPETKSLSSQLADCDMNRKQYFNDAEKFYQDLTYCQSKLTETCNPIVNHINKQWSCWIANLDWDMQKIVSVVVSKNDYDNRYHTSYILENDDYSRTECRQGDFIFSQ